MAPPPTYVTKLVEGSGGVKLAVDQWQLPSRAEPRRPGFVLVHGLASNARLYDGVAERLVHAHRPTVSVDLRGHGRSDKPDRGYDYDTMSEDLASILVAQAIDPGPEFFDKPILVGQSFGANLVLEFAARHPEMISGVACIDGGTIDLRSSFDSFEEMLEALTPPRLAGVNYKDIEQRFFEMHPDWPEMGVRGSLANFEVRPDGTIAPWLSLDHHLAILKAMWSSRPPDIFTKLKVPVLLMPAESPGAPTAWATSKRQSTEVAAGAIARSATHWFSPADHDVHAQHPAEVADVLLETGADLFSS